MSTRMKLILAVLAGFLVSGSVGILAVDRVHRDTMEVAVARELESSRRSFENLLAAEVEALEVGAVLLAADPRLPSLLEASDRDGLIALASDSYADLNREFGVSHWYYEETSKQGRRVIARVHHPEKFGDALDRLTYHQAEEQGAGAGLELGVTAFALRVVRPVNTENGSVVGFVELGKEVSHVLGQMKQLFGSEYSLVIDKAAMGLGAEQQWDEIRRAYPNAAEWRSHPQNIQVDSTDGASVWEGSVTSLPNDGSVLSTSWEDDRAIATVAFPVNDAAGTRIGAVIARIDVTQHFESIRTAQVKMVVTMGLVMAVLSVALLLFVNRYVLTRPSGTRAG